MVRLEPPNYRSAVNPPDGGRKARHNDNSTFALLLSL
jgi:hypothetical protein